MLHLIFSQVSHLSLHLCTIARKHLLIFMQNGGVSYLLKGQIRPDSGEDEAGQIRHLNLLMEHGVDAHTEDEPIPTREMLSAPPG